MSKERSGYTYFDTRIQRWIARVSFIDKQGKRRNLKRQAESESKAESLLRRLVGSLETEESRIQVDSERMTFEELTDRYSALKVIPAEYRNDRKVCGMRHPDKVKFRIAALLAFFGKMRVRTITVIIAN